MPCIGVDIKISSGAVDISGEGATVTYYDGTAYKHFDDRLSPVPQGVSAVSCGDVIININNSDFCETAYCRFNKLFTLNIVALVLCILVAISVVAYFVHKKCKKPKAPKRKKQARKVKVTIDTPDVEAAESDIPEREATEMTDVEANRATCSVLLLLVTVGFCSAGFVQYHNLDVSGIEKAPRAVGFCQCFMDCANDAECCGFIMNPGCNLLWGSINVSNGSAGSSEVFVKVANGSTDCNALFNDSGDHSVVAIDALSSKVSAYVARFEQYVKIVQAIDSMPNTEIQKPVTQLVRRRRSAEECEHVPSPAVLYYRGVLRAEGYCYDGYAVFPRGSAAGLHEFHTVEVNGTSVVLEGIYDAMNHTIATVQHNGIVCKDEVRHKRSIDIFTDFNGVVTIDGASKVMTCNPLTTVCNPVINDATQYAAERFAKSGITRIERDYTSVNVFIHKVDSNGHIPYARSCYNYNAAYTLPLPYRCKVTSISNAFGVYRVFKTLPNDQTWFLAKYPAETTWWFCNKDQDANNKLTSSTDKMFTVGQVVNTAYRGSAFNGALKCNDGFADDYTSPDGFTDPYFSVSELKTISIKPGTPHYTFLIDGSYVMIPLSYFTSATSFTVPALDQADPQTYVIHYARFSQNSNSALRTVQITQPMCTASNPRGVSTVPTYNLISQLLPGFLYANGVQVPCSEWSKTYTQTIYFTVPTATMTYGMSNNHEHAILMGYPPLGSYNQYYIKPDDEKCAEIFATKEQLGCFSGELIVQLKMRRIDLECLNTNTNFTAKHTFEYNHTGDADAAFHGIMVQGVDTALPIPNPCLVLLYTPAAGYLPNRKVNIGPCNDTHADGCYKNIGGNSVIHDVPVTDLISDNSRAKRAAQDSAGTFAKYFAHTKCLSTGNFVHFIWCYWHKYFIIAIAVVASIIVLIFVTCLLCRTRSRYTIKKAATELYHAGYKSIGTVLGKFGKSETRKMRKMLADMGDDDLVVFENTLRNRVKPEGDAVGKKPRHITLKPYADESTRRLLDVDSSRSTGFALVLACALFVAVTAGPIEFYKTTPKTAEILASTHAMFDPKTTYAASDKLTQQSFQAPIGTLPALVVGSQPVCGNDGNCKCQIKGAIGTMTLSPYAVLPVSAKCGDQEGHVGIQFHTMFLNYQATYLYTTSDWTVVDELDYSCGGSCDKYDCLKHIKPDVSQPVYFNYKANIANSLSTCCYRINEGWLLQGAKVVPALKRVVHVFRLNVVQKNGVFCLNDADSYQCQRTPDNDGKFQVSFGDVQVPDNIIVGAYMEDGHFVRLFTGNIAQPGFPTWRGLGDIQINWDNPNKIAVWPSSSPFTWGSAQFSGCAFPNYANHKHHWFTPYQKVTPGISLVSDHKNYPDFGDSFNNLRLRKGSISFVKNIPALSLDIEYLTSVETAVVTYNGMIDLTAGVEKFKTSVSKFNITSCNFTVSSTLSSYCDVKFAWASSNNNFMVSFSDADNVMHHPTQKVVIRPTVTDYRIRFNVVENVTKVKLDVKIGDTVVATAETNSVIINKPPGVDSTTDTMAITPNDASEWHSGPTSYKSKTNQKWALYIIGCIIGALLIAILLACLASWLLNKSKSRNLRYSLI